MSSVMNAIGVPASELSGVEKSAPQEHNFAISYLRAFITVPVLAHLDRESWVKSCIDQIVVAGEVCLNLVVIGE